MIFKWIVKLFGIYKGTSKICRGALKGKYEVYDFLGKIYEFKVD